MKERIEKFNPNPFINGPADYLVKSTAKSISLTKPFETIFGDFIDDYKRMDYGARNLPACRVYNLVGFKNQNYFFDGDLTIDAIFPSSIRRKETQELQDVTSSAFMQWFRSQDFFTMVSENAPGLNQLGREFRVDKSLGFEFEDDLVPLTQMTVNFRIDLRQWDLYLEQQLRTVDQPFEKTLAELRRITGKIIGVDDSGIHQVEIDTDQEIE